ncbi:MAG: hypothetical protein U9R47_03560 [Actinomycetota bacterium]|nr:hypothetical protein [Actinomycetota bacterium]
MAAIVLDPGLGQADRDRVGEAAGDLPVITAADPVSVGGSVDDRLRYGNVSG